MTKKNKNKQTILLTTLAEYQTVFWLDICLELEAQGANVYVLSFDDRSCELLDRAGIANVNIPQSARKFAETLSTNEIFEIFDRFGIQDVNFMESHERLVFKIYDGDKLDIKFSSYIAALDDAFDRLKVDPSTSILVQELGGFISVLASLLVSKKHLVDNYFLEPSFFRGRLFSLKNTLYAPRIKPELASKVSDEVADYIRATTNQRAIVIPRKDRHQYSKASQKLLNTKNIKRLARKLVDQYIYRKHQEFGHNWVYVGIHFQMLINSLWLRKKYSSIEECGNYVYFPFHVPNDVAITLRSPEYLDQLTLVEFIARTVPSGVNVVVKEHPAMIGALDAKRLINLLKKYDNLKLISPSRNNFDAINAAKAVISINSKSGAEALMLGKPIFVLGNAFYEDCPLVVKIEAITHLPEALRGLSSISSSMMELYFQTVWDQTFPGELYINDPENISNIADAMMIMAASSKSIAESEK